MRLTQRLEELLGDVRLAVRQLLGPRVVPAHAGIQRAQRQVCRGIREPAGNRS